MSGADDLMESYEEHIDALATLALQGDELATKSLSVIAMLIKGWRPGGDDPNGGGEPLDTAEIIELALYRRAA
jgi:hypothetical protein